jgi:hypothetical protein
VPAPPALQGADTLTEYTFITGSASTLRASAALAFYVPRSHPTSTECALLDPATIESR